MVRASKTPVEKVSAVETPASLEVAAAPLEVAAAPAKKARKAKAPASASLEAPASASLDSASEAPVVSLEAAAPVAEIPANEVVEDAVVADIPTLLSRVVEYATKLQQYAAMTSSLKSDFKALEKLIAKSEKLALKNSHKKRKASGNKAPSGFVKPTLITDELASFLGKELGTKMARTEVSKEINLYIREHKLQDADNGRKIIPDDRLSVLLKLTQGQELTYFNLQKYMKHHFIKEEKTETKVVV
jgi:chromatin remodeling complex protein RSC6